jgi:hypothetical protein
VVFGGFIAQEAERADIRAGGVAGGRGFDGAEFAVPGDPVDVGFVGDFKRGFALEVVEGGIGGAVGDDEGIFHGEIASLLVV